jgi:hypothetical protein
MRQRVIPGKIHPFDRSDLADVMDGLITIESAMRANTRREAKNMEIGGRAFWRVTRWE